MGLFGTALDALKWGFGINFKNNVRWILLTILSILPFVWWIAEGALLKVLKGEEPDIAPPGDSFINGLLWFIIAVTYELIPLVLFMVIGGAAFLPAITGGDIGAAIGAGVGIIGFILCFVVAILFALIMVPAMINFARTGQFSKAFAFSELFAMIKEIGWGKYILAIIVLIIVQIILGIVIFVLLGTVNFILLFIPVVGPIAAMVISVIIGLLLIVPEFCFIFKYWNDLFA